MALKQVASPPITNYPTTCRSNLTSASWNAPASTTPHSLRRRLKSVVRQPIQWSRLQTSTRRISKYERHFSEDGGKPSPYTGSTDRAKHTREHGRVRDALQLRFHRRRFKARGAT